MVSKLERAYALSLRWVVWRERRAGGGAPFVDEQGAITRRSRLLRYWARAR